jgi:hypothetical protein
MRNTPRALNKPELTLGVPKQAIIVACLSYGLCLLLPFNKLLGACTILLGLIVTRILAQYDRDLILFVRALFQCSEYDAKLRKVYKLEVK